MRRKDKESAVRFMSISPERFRSAYDGKRKKEDEAVGGGIKRMRVRERERERGTPLASIEY
jgi:hypothetical protein